VEQVLAGANAEGRHLFVDDVPKAEFELDNLAQSWDVLFRKLGDAAGAEG
jgi:hypothetical protein